MNETHHHLQRKLVQFGIPEKEFTKETSSKLLRDAALELAKDLISNNAIRIQADRSPTGEYRIYYMCQVLEK